MRREQYKATELSAFFRKRKIATLEQLKAVLGDPTKRTVFRKLDSLDYLSSYSHRGMYYTLQGIAEFDAHGLWSCRSVWFSRFGDLSETVKAFLDRSESGFSTAELSDALHVKTKHPLLRLFRKGQIDRETIQGRYIYFSGEAGQGLSQRKNRQKQQPKRLARLIVSNPDLAAEEAKAVILLFISTLDERQRRLFAGLESLKLGYGGDDYIAELFGMNPHTVARGRHELVEGDWEEGRLRGSGGGRPSTKKKRPKS